MEHQGEIGEINNMMGIYKIQNKITGQIYIGCSLDIGKRWQEHIHYLEVGRHHNKKLALAFKEHGILNFIFEVVELVDDPEKIFEVEQKYLDEINLDEHYNMINSFGLHKIYREQKTDEFFEWLDKTWVFETCGKGEKGCRIYSEHKEEVETMAINCNILNIYPYFVNFNKITKFLSENGYYIEDRRTRINYRNARYKFIHKKPIDKPQHP